MISSTHMPRRLFWAVWITIIILAAFLRLWKLGSVPVSLYWDEAAMLVDLKSVTATGQDMHGRPWYQVIYPSYGDYKLPMYIWAAEASSFFFGVHPFAQRLPSALAGITTVIVAGWLARILFESASSAKYQKKHLDLLQLWVMVIVATSPWSILFSRTGFEGHMGQVLLAASIGVALWAYQTKKYWLLGFASVIAAAATYSYFSVRFVWVGLFSLLIGVLFVDEFGQKKKLPQILSATKFFVPAIICVVLFALLLIPLLTSPIAGDLNKFRLGTTSVLNNDQLVLESNVYRELAGNTPLDRLFYHRGWLYLRELAKNYSDHFSLNFLFLTGDSNLRHGTGQAGLFLLVTMPLFFIGATVMAKRHPLRFLFLLGWWILAVLPAAVPENTPHALRSLNALVPLSILIGFGSYWLWQKIHDLRRPHDQFAHVAVIGMLAVNFIFFWAFYTSVYPNLSADDWQSGYAPLAKRITQLSESGETVYIRPFDDRFYLWLMTYGPYSAKDFQNWPTKDYKFAATDLPNSFSNIEFSVPEVKQLSQIAQSKSIRLAGESTEIEKLCQELITQHCEFERVKDEVGKNKFSIAKIVSN
jgi:4-amino-4-deoxy-L-arabinose transferase-like glycosyltransferase